MNKSLTEIMRERVASKYCILNKDLIVKNNVDELIKLVIDVVKNIPTGMSSRKKKDEVEPEEDTGKPKRGKKKKVKVEEPPRRHFMTYIRHDVKMPTQRDKSDNALIQYVKYREIQFDYPYYIKLEDSFVLEVDVTIMFSPYAYKANFQDALIYNTKNILEGMKDMGVSFESSPAVEKILAYEGIPDIPENNEEYTMSLLHNLKLYVPINTTGCYHIGGRRHYNGYLLTVPRQFVDGNKKLAIQHPSSVSYVYVNNDRVWHQVFGEDINPFAYDAEDNWEALKGIFEASVNEEQLEIIKNMHDMYVKDAKDGNVKLPIDKALAEINATEVYAAIITLFDRINNPDTYTHQDGIFFRKYASLRGSHEPNIEHFIRDCVPSFRNNEPKKAEKKWNVHPHGMLTTMINKRTFPSFNETNPMDVFHMLSFSRIEIDNLQDSARYVSLSELYKICPIYTPGQDIGASGALCPSTTAKITW